MDTIIINTLVDVKFQLVKKGNLYYVDDTFLTGSQVAEFFLSGAWEVVK